MKQRIKRITIQTIAILFWIYAVLKLFILDVDAFIIRRLFPSAIWLIEYRGVVTIGFAAILALVVWNRKLFWALLYIAFFPIIAVLFHLPVWLIRRRAWTLTVALIAATISMIESLRSTIILVGLFVVGIMFIAVGSNNLLLWIGIGCLVIFIGGLYYRTIRGAFYSSLDVFLPQNLDRLRSGLAKGLTPSEEIRRMDIQVMNETQRNMWAWQLQLNILFNRMCYFVADKLRTLQQGWISAAVAGIKIIWLFITTLFIFSLLNLGLYKLAPSQFEVHSTARGFDFLWYTFQASFVNNVPEIIPVGVIARSLFMMNGFTSVLILLTIVVFFLTGVQTARNSAQMDGLINRIREQGELTESFILEVFGLTLYAAIEKLVHMRGLMVDWILRMSPDLKIELISQSDEQEQNTLPEVDED